MPSNPDLSYEKKCNVTLVLPKPYAELSIFRQYNRAPEALKTLKPQMSWEKMKLNYFCCYGL